MASPAYAIINLDLAAPAGPYDRRRIVDVGVPIDSVAVLGLPVGVSASLAVGENRPLIPLLTQGMSIEEICPRNDEGLYFTAPVAAGIVTLFVSFSGSRIGGV